MALFTLHAPYAPGGSQPGAIAELVAQRPGKSTLLGVTGSGKTFTLAQVIAQQDKPVIILSPNKTLAAQLYEEFSLFFPENKICYFVSYYDYYQPESYLPAQDIYIPKETKINAEIERLRIEATASIINRKDTIIIASVSCIYSLGNPTDYRTLALSLNVGDVLSRAQLLHKLVFIQYQRNDTAHNPGTFAAHGPIIDIYLPYQREVLRVELEGDKIARLNWRDKHNLHIIRELTDTLIFPAKHFVTTQEKKESAIRSIQTELDQWLPQLKKPLYQERLRQRVSHDIEQIEQFGTCPGIENYSAHFNPRTSAQAPSCLFDFFDRDFLLIIDESHIAIPQLQGMHRGDRARKKPLIEFGFRLPSAYDNRPLKFEEIEKYFKDTIFVSATPGPYELTHSKHLVEQIIRPTGLVDPQIEIHPRTGQLDHLVTQIQKTSQAGHRTLVTVLTKKLAEELAHYLEEKQLKVCYLHSSLKTPQRTEILQKLRLGVFDCIVGVNLLREGLDLPEVALVAVMDADIESFLRDKRSLIQIIGRAARNTASRVLFYADKITHSMQQTILETERRRALQQQYNQEHNITPQSAQRSVVKSIVPLPVTVGTKKQKKPEKSRSLVDIRKELAKLEKLMNKKAELFLFEEAIQLRSQWLKLKEEYGIE